MLVSYYDNFVQKTDQTAGRPHAERLDIATYGIASEVGSVIAAIKKRLLAHAGKATWNVPDADIVEELGDLIWYCFLLARVGNPRKPVNIFAHDIANLKREIGAGDARAERIRSVLDPSKRQLFLKAAEQFPKATRRMVFEDYQSIAFLTARTSNQTLAEVCLVVLQQLSAQLMRPKLPLIERELNGDVVERPTNDILGEMSWHIAALASLFKLRLSDVAQANIEKVTDRFDLTIRTPLHDSDLPEAEQLPRRFSISFATVAGGRSRMSWNGAQLGDELTDNSYDDDGYRFHDVMHLAHAAKLGWSPVLRRLMKRKRKSQPRIDEIEDGARAQIVEEAVIKTLHAEGERLAELRGKSTHDGAAPLFLNGEVSFSMLKFIRSLVSDLEVETNRYSEWEAAIVEGFSIFQKLRETGRGTVTVDLNARSITYSEAGEIRLPASARARPRLLVRRRYESR